MFDNEVPLTPLLVSPNTKAGPKIKLSNSSLKYKDKKEKGVSVKIKKDSTLNLRVKRRPSRIPITNKLSSYLLKRQNTLKKDPGNNLGLVSALVPNSEDGKILQPLFSYPMMCFDESGVSNGVS